MCALSDTGPGAEAEDVAGLEPAEAGDHPEVDEGITLSQLRTMLPPIHLTLFHLYLRDLLQQLPS